MNVSEAVKRVQRVRYKPGFKFRAGSSFKALKVTVFSTVPDNRNLGSPNGMVQVSKDLLLAESELQRMDDRAFDLWLLDGVWWLERHEMLEHFEVDGERVFDPHELTRVPMPTDYVPVRENFLTDGFKRLREAEDSQRAQRIRGAEPTAVIFDEFRIDDVRNPDDNVMDLMPKTVTFKTQLDEDTLKLLFGGSVFSGRPTKITDFTGA